MYTFLATFYDMDGGDDKKITLGIEMSCINEEDLNGMNPDEYAWKKAVESAMFYVEKNKPAFTLSIGSIEFISC